MNNDTDFSAPDLIQNTDPHSDGPASSSERNPRIPAPKGIVTITFNSPFQLGQTGFKDRVLVLDAKGNPKGWV